MSKIMLRRINAAGDMDITQLVQVVTWSGASRQCARTLDVTIAYSAIDQSLPAVSVNLGDLMELYVDNTLRFSGYVFTSSRRSEGNEIEYACVDRGFYLKRNCASYNFIATTPESVTRKICTDFGIPIASLSATGYTFSRSFAGVPLYQIIMTGYTLAARKNGKAYALRFDGRALRIFEKVPDPTTPILLPEGTLLSSSVSESVENMINQVMIEDDKGCRVSVKKDINSIKAYGLMQSVIHQRNGGDSTGEADELLRENGVQQKITVTNLGDVRMLSDSCLIVRNPAIGIDGLFWIETDKHSWKNNMYQNSLTLNFRRNMDLQRAGSEK